MWRCTIPVGNSSLALHPKPRGIAEDRFDVSRGPERRATWVEVEQDKELKKDSCGTV